MPLSGTPLSFPSVALFISLSCQPFAPTQHHNSSNLRGSVEVSHARRRAGLVMHGWAPSPISITSLAVVNCSRVENIRQANQIYVPWGDWWGQAAAYLQYLISGLVCKIKGRKFNDGIMSRKVGLCRFNGEKWRATQCYDVKIWSNWVKEETKDQGLWKPLSPPVFLFVCIIAYSTYVRWMRAGTRQYGSENFAVPPSQPRRGFLYQRQIPLTFWWFSLLCFGLSPA